MIESTEAYKTAVVADARRTYLRVVIDISDPDIVYGAVEAQNTAPWSKTEELHNKTFELDRRYATLEKNRWLLDGSFSVFPDDFGVEGETAYASEELCSDDGVFAQPQWVELRFSGVDVLQACSVYFSEDAVDGVPENFTVEVRQGGTAYHTEVFQGNAAARVSLDGFTVYNPDAIRVTVTKWSTSSRRMRVLEIIPGIFEIWGNDDLAGVTIAQQADISNVSIPYGTCKLRMDNTSKRFEPRAKSGLFQSIEERQGIEISIGVGTPAGVDYKPIGVYYQFAGGWRTSDNGATITWSLVDIVGLLASREFVPPATLPVTLSGWLAALVGQLGVNFGSRYTVDKNYEDTPVTSLSRDDVTGLSCGDILRFACMAAGVWPRADAETGYLAAEPLWSQGNRLTVDNIISYPTMMANNDVAAVVFTLHDGTESGTQYVVGGTSDASSETISVDNPFIHTASQALTAARLMLSTYGGNRIETTGRGDPSAEIGDVETVELDEYSAMSARRIFQTFQYQDGVLQGCQSTFLQASGALEFENRVLLSESGTWTAPSGVAQLRIVLGGGGTGGAAGTSGTWEEEGQKGADGDGGKIWYGTININDGQSFNVSIGAGGFNGAAGGDTVFGAYSSANGRVYLPSFTDIAGGDVFGRSGAANPRENTSDGGAGGSAGIKGNRHTETYNITHAVYTTHYFFENNAGVKVEIDAETYYGAYEDYPPEVWSTTQEKTGSYQEKRTETIIDNYPGPGGAGKPGADGFVLIYYNK